MLSSKVTSCFFITGFYFFITGCGYKKEQNKVAFNATKTNSIKLLQSNNLAYSYRTFTITDTACKIGMGCTNVEIKYPTFKNGLKLKSFIDQQLLEFMEAFKTVTNIDVAFKAYQKNLVASLDSTTDEDGTSLSYSQLRIDVLSQYLELIILERDDEMGGGAHPNHNYSFINWDRNSDSSISLNDIFVKGYKLELRQIAESTFRTDKNLKQTGCLTGFNFENDKFTLSSDFYLNDKGITFFYQIYSIAPYSEGPTELLIPYKSIKHLLRPNTVLSQFIN